MLTIGFLRKYRERPAHFANAWAAFYFAIAIALVVGGVFTGITSLHGVLVMLGGLGFFALTGVCFLAGLFAELLIRQNRPTGLSNQI